MTNKVQSEKLKKGVSILYDMEVNNYLMTNAIIKLDERIAYLGQPARIKKPERMSADLVLEICDIPLFEILMFIGGVIGAIYGIVWGWNESEGILGKFFGVILGGLFVCVLGVIAGIILTVIITLIKSNCEDKGLEKKYQQDLLSYQKKLNCDKARIKVELKEKNQLIIQRNMLEKRLAESQSKLTDFYTVMHIDREYRNLISIGYINRFIELGISNKLEGTDGLYFLIMQELRWEQISYTLQEISAKLDTLIGSQNRLYNELCEINQRCESLVTETAKSVNAMSKSNRLLENIEAETALTAYNTHRIAEETAFQSFMILY